MRLLRYARNDKQEDFLRIHHICDLEFPVYPGLGYCSNLKYSGTRTTESEVNLDFHRHYDYVESTANSNFINGESV